MGPLHVVLVGLSGAGKTAVGQLVAEQLGVGFTDLDQAVGSAAGGSIADIFARDGEHRFRELERDAMGRTLALPPRVIASGGGWPAQPGNLEATEGCGLVIYLKVSPETAAERLKGVSDRPLLAGAPAGVRAKLAELLAVREKHFHRAAHTVATDGMTPRAVADAVVTLARKYGGW